MLNLSVFICRQYDCVYRKSQENRKKKKFPVDIIGELSKVAGFVYTINEPLEHDRSHGYAFVKTHGIFV